MQEKTKEKIAFSLAVVLLVWAIWHSLKPHQALSDAGYVMPKLNSASASVAPASIVALPVLNPPTDAAPALPNSGCNCSSSNSCSNNASIIPGLSHIFSIANAWQNATIDAANSTLATLASNQNNSGADPFNVYTFNPPPVSAYAVMDATPDPNQDPSVRAI